MSGRLTAAVAELVYAFREIGIEDFTIDLCSYESGAKLMKARDDLGKHMAESYQRGRRYKGSIAGVAVSWQDSEEILF